MANVDWDRQRDDRLRRYGARPLDQVRWILIRTEPEYAATYAGQVATLVAANLIGRISRSVAVDIPDSEILDPIPGAGGRLVKEVLSGMVASDPQGRYEPWESQCKQPYVVHLGSDGSQEIIHGVGWRAYVGPPASPLTSESLYPYNPVGPAFAAIVAATRLFVHQFAPPQLSRVFDCYSWSDWEGTKVLTNARDPMIPHRLKVGDIWTVGCGSVGSAVLYFLGLSGTDFTASLFDMDDVALHNITRSPIFTESDIGQPKVRAVTNFLRRCGIDRVAEHPIAFNEAEVWTARPTGTPDLLVPTANERNVRSFIEAYYPPLQIYGTTGANWQASVVSHVPMTTGCSRCLFPGGYTPETMCATDPDVERSEATDEHVDASLPFLSFAAGLMAAADILKVAANTYPYLGNRGIFLTWDGPRLITAPPHDRAGCPCHDREESIYHSVLNGSTYNSL